MLKVGMVGCGTIGSAICRAIDEGLDPASDKNIRAIEPHNPTVSDMAALSAIALLQRITASLVVGT